MAVAVAEQEVEREHLHEGHDQIAAVPLQLSKGGDRDRDGVVDLLSGGVVAVVAGEDLGAAVQLLVLREEAADDDAAL
ncbi:MAG: hypothetical protein U0234_06865 [Sandaracinus sp.]